MKVLLDTHAFLWFISKDGRTPNTWRPIIEDTTNEIYLSTASLWEMAIKSSIGKLSLDFSFSELISEHIEKYGILRLTISDAHLIQLERLPHNHRDPFDRLIIAQSMTELLPILTVDPQFKHYDVTLIK